MQTVQQFLGDGDGPATRGQPEETRGPLLVMARKVTANWKVSREGELVVFQVGNATLRLRAVDAIQIGQALLAKGTEAKVQAGMAGVRVPPRS